MSSHFRLIMSTGVKLGIKIHWIFRFTKVSPSLTSFSMVEVATSSFPYTDFTSLVSLNLFAEVPRLWVCGPCPRKYESTRITETASRVAPMKTFARFLTFVTRLMFATGPRRCSSLTGTISL